MKSLYWLFSKKKNFLIVLLTFLVLFLWLPLSLHSTTYYVDATNGNDSNTGTSTDQAWKTIAKVNSSSFNPGDQILFKRGEVWREKLTIPSGGDANNQLTFGNYGSGDLPVIMASDSVRGGELTEVSTNKYYLTGISQDPRLVFFNGTWGTDTTASQYVDEENEFFWTTLGDDTLFFYTSDTTTIEYGARENAIHSGGSYDYITLDGLGAKYAYASGIDGYGRGWVIQNCKSSYNYYFGIRMAGQTGQVIDWLVDSNTVFRNGATGIAFLTDVDSCTISNNNVYENGYIREDGSHDYSGGIRSVGTHGTSVTANTIQGNHCYRNGYNARDSANVGTQRGFGIWLDTVGPNNVIQYNECDSNYFGGIKLDIDSLGSQVSYNLCYNHLQDDAVNYGSGISVDGNPHDSKIYNNVSYGNRFGLTVQGSYSGGCVAGSCEDVIVKNNILTGNLQPLRTWWGAENDGTCGSGNVYEYNSLGLESATDSLVEWGWKNFLGTYDAWETSYGSSTNSVESDPAMTDPANADFNLQSGSPCIDAGIDWGQTQDIEGTTQQGTAWDIGAYEFVVSGWQEWTKWGYLEYIGKYNNYLGYALK